MTSATGIPLCIAIGLACAFGCGWSCRGIEESTTFRECPPVRVTLDAPSCAAQLEATRDASAITCAMAIGAAVDAMQREDAIDDWAEERADDSIDAQVPLERWRTLP